MKSGSLGLGDLIAVEGDFFVMTSRLGTMLNEAEGG